MVFVSVLKSIGFAFFFVKSTTICNDMQAKKMLRRAEINCFRLETREKRAIKKNICRFLFFFLHFLEIFVRIVANLPLFVKNVDFFKQLS